MLRRNRPHAGLIVVACSLLLTGPTLALAQAGQQTATIQPKPTTQDGGRYSRQEEGWFWYEPEPAPPPPPPPPPEEQPAQAHDPDAPKPFSTEWIAAELEKALPLAIDNPDDKDAVERYLLLQKLAMDRAEQFALSHRRFASLNPGIDETIQNPVGGTSRFAMNRAQDLNMDETVKRISEIAGIWYFYASECAFCHQQNPAVEILSHTTNMSVLPISLDGRSSTDGALPNWRPNRGQAEKLGVIGTPTMYLVNPDTQRVILLSNGVRTVPDMKRRIVEIAHAEEWITKEEYDLAMRGLPRRFLTDGLDLDADIEDDPDQILAMLREASVHGQVQDTSLDDSDQSTMTPWAPPARTDQ